MDNYDISEQLFLDIWEEYGCPKEICNRVIISNVINEIIKRSKTQIVLDHYSQINFDYISKIENKDRYTLVYWFDKNKTREKYLAKELDESDMLEWWVFGYATYEYILLDIEKIKFVKVKNHLFILLKSNLIPQRQISKYILEGNEHIETEEKTSELYTKYTFFEGNPANTIKHFCLVGNLPYYTCVIQPKENIPDTGVSKMILLQETIIEVKKRLEKAHTRLLKIEENDIDELCGVGNTIRRIMEYVLKYYCIINKIDLTKLQIEQKYGYIELSDLRKIINKDGNVIISQTLVNKANELSHDSGTSFSKTNLIEFYSEVFELFNQLTEIIKYRNK